MKEGEKERAIQIPGEGLKNGLIQIAISGYWCTI
mgnify:CR=1 FL=1